MTQIYEVFIGYQDTLKIVANEIQKLATNVTKAHKNVHKEEKKKYYKVTYLIQATLYAVNFARISHVENAIKAWDTLIKYYEGCHKVEGVKLQSLGRQWKLLQMEKYEIVAGYASNIQGFIHMIRSYGEVMAKKMVIERLWGHLHLIFIMW